MFMSIFNAYGSAPVFNRYMSTGSEPTNAVALVAPRTLMTGTFSESLTVIAVAAVDPASLPPSSISGPARAGIDATNPSTIDTDLAFIVVPISFAALKLYSSLLQMQVFSATFVPRCNYCYHPRIASYGSSRRCG